MTHRNHHEREFEAFLAGEESELARLYRRLPQSEPDARLDAAVLNLARAAVEPQRVNALRHANVRHRRPLWLVGLSSAAGVVLAAGIAWQMRSGFNERNLPALSESPAARAERDVIPISAITPPDEPAPAASPPPPPLQESAAGAAPPPAPRPPLADTVKAKPAKTAAHRREVELAAASEARKDSAMRFEAPAPAETPPAVSTTAAEPLAATTEASASTGLAESESAGRSTAESSPSAAAKPQAFPGSAVPDYNSVERKAAIASGSRRDDYGVDVDAASADPLAKRERASRQLAKETRAVDKRAAPVAAAPAVAAAAPAPATATEQAADAAAGAQDTELQRNARLAPDEWIKQIRELLRAQRKADALENLELLRRKHPAHVIPADLRELR
jgi:hypothetical protein